MRTPAIAMLLLSCATLQLSSQSTAQEIAASFSKHKQVVKAKHGVRVDKYKDVQSEPTVRQNLSDYSGVYESDLGDVITVEVAGDGRVRATSNNIELENARIEHGVLTADGFVGAFLTRTDRDSPTDPGTVTHGLGVILTEPVEVGGNTYDKLFYQLKR